MPQPYLMPSCTRLQYYRGAEAAIVVYDITSFVSRAATPLVPPSLAPAKHSLTNPAMRCGSTRFACATHRSRSKVPKSGWAS